MAERRINARDGAVKAGIDVLEEHSFSRTSRQGWQAIQRRLVWSPTRPASTHLAAAPSMSWPMRTALTRGDLQPGTWHLREQRFNRYP